MSQRYRARNVPPGDSVPNGWLQYEFYAIERSLSVIAGDQISDSAITSTKIADNSITTPKLVANAVTAAKIQANTITAAQIAANTITAGQIAALTITSAQIAAGAITASKLLVGAPGSALNSDPGTSDANAWPQTTGSGAAPTLTTITDGAVGPNVIRGSNSRVFNSPGIPVDLGKTYRVRCWYRRNSTAPNLFYLGVALFDNAGARIDGTAAGGSGGTFWFYATVVTPTTTWTEADVQFGAGTANAFPVNAYTMAPLLLLNDGSATGFHEAQDIRIEEALPTTLIKDGAITTAKIVAGAITTTTLAARAVSIDKLFVGSYDNLILDPGFEGTSSLTGEGGWTTAGTAASGGTWSVVSSPVRSGVKAAQFSVTGQTISADLCANGHMTSTSYGTACTDGDKLYFEMWCRKLGTGAPASPFLYMRFLNAAGGTISNITGSAIIPTQTYQKLSVTATAPALAAFVQFVIEIPSGGAEHLVFDDAYARRMVTGSIVVDGEITATKISVSQLSAIAVDAGTITAGTVRDSNSKFVIDLANALLTVTDNQGSPVQRVALGKVAGGTVDYGLRVQDQNGAIVADFTSSNRIFAVPLQDQGSKNADFTLNLSTGLTQIVQLGASGLNLTFSNPVNGGRYRVWFQQDATGSRTFPTITNAVMYTNDTAPTLTATPGALDLFELEYRASPTARFTCITLQANVLLPTPNVVSVTVSSLASGTSHSVSMPASVATGDLLLMLITSSGASSRTTPTGWNLGFASGIAGAYYRVSDGTEGGTTVGVTTVSNEVMAAQVYRINKWFGTTAGVSVLGATGAPGTSGDPPSLTPGWTDRSLWIAMVGIGALNTITDPANYANAQQTDSSTTARLRSLRRVLYAATEDPAAFTFGSTSWGVATIAIRPPS